MKLSIISVCEANNLSLFRTLESVTSSNFDRDKVELIVVCPDKVISPPEIKNFHHVFDKKEGIFSAMNLGLERARGEFVFFLNGGDKFFSSDIIAQVWNFLNDNTKIIAGNVRIYFENIESITDCSPWIPHQGAFIPMQLFEERLYDKNLKFFGDLEFWLYLKKSNKFFVERLGFTVAEFQYGGLGNSPAYCFSRARERIKLALIYGDSPRYFLRFARAFISKVVCLLLGKKFYYYLSINKRLW